MKSRVAWHESSDLLQSLAQVLPVRSPNNIHLIGRHYSDRKYVDCLQRLIFDLLWVAESMKSGIIVWKFSCTPKSIARHRVARCQVDRSSQTFEEAVLKRVF